MCIFSQYGEILDINLVRDKTTGRSKGFAYLRYEDQRSTILAVDNFSGAKVTGRPLRVDHVSEYKQTKKMGDNVEDWEEDKRTSMNVAPIALLYAEQQRTADHNGVMPIAEDLEEDYSNGIDSEDPMFDYLVKERRDAAQAQRKMKTSHRWHSNEDKERRRSRRHRSRSHDTRRTSDRDTGERFNTRHRRLAY